MHVKLCKICVKEFEAKRSDTKYCSEKCRDRQYTIGKTKRNQEELKKQLIPIPCGVCNELFTPSKYRKDQIYCGEKCLIKAMSKKAKEEGRSQEQSRLYRARHPERKSKMDMDYKNKIRFGGNKYNALERDGHKCVKCGKDNPRSLIIHHKDHSGSTETPNNDMDNLETLCRSCHMNHHVLEDETHVSNKTRISIPVERIMEAINNSYTGKDSACYLGITPSVFYRMTKLNNIVPEYKKKSCKTCGTLFNVTVAQEYCSKKCWPSLNAAN